jgi:hypothetical protein
LVNVDVERVTWFRMCNHRSRIGLDGDDPQLLGGVVLAAWLQEELLIPVGRENPQLALSLK